MYELFHSVAIVLMQINQNTSFLLCHHLVRGEQIAMHCKIRTLDRRKGAGFHGFLRETNDHLMCKQKNEGHLNLHARREIRK